MIYHKWFQKTVKQVTPLSEKQLYLRVGSFGMLIFGLCFVYTSYLKIPNVVNKSVADSATILVGLSMMLSALCYFWDFVDSKIIYRKHLGLIGFAFAVLHLILSKDAFLKLLQIESWQKSILWAPLTGAIALTIFTLMALISNQYAAHQLGGITWRRILRTGYIALVLVFAHVYLLKIMRWVTWYQEGMKTLPSMSLVVTIFIAVVLLMRMALWWSQWRKLARLK